MLCDVMLQPVQLLCCSRAGALHRVTLLNVHLKANKPMRQNLKMKTIKGRSVEEFAATKSCPFSNKP